ncbi:ferritin-like domain-containing protein [uncultured Methanobrevibacter sp.]|uniref:ferritin-like domain-containing protein n=1 Tax=uncultured Methanobrevibacter sp. TaxID=253161 RepID=UPI00262C5457
MSDKEQTIQVLQAIVTGLTSNSIGHRIQSKIFADLGFQSLGDKYANHADEEMGFVEQFMDRILDLGGELKQEAQEEKPIYKDIIEFIEADYQVSVEGIGFINQIIESGILDSTTLDLMKVYLKDEEEDMYWSEQQLDLCKMIGKQNYLTQLLINDQTAE